MKYNNIYRLGVKILTLRFKIINNYMNKQQIEEQDTFFEFFDEWTEPLPVPEEYCLDNDVEDFIIDKIKEALLEHNGNQTKASERLGIKRTTLIAKCKKLNIFSV
jgi:transcriptional regulator with PAS, ATPase and Fis domain